MNHGAFIFLGLCALALGACHRVSPEDGAAAMAAVRENVAAMERKDLDAVIATIHSESPQFENTVDLLPKIFDEFDLKYTLTGLRVLGGDRQEVRVGFTQRTEKLRGNATFKDNTVEGVHALRKEDNRWKIYSTPELHGVEPKPLKEP